VPIVSAPAVFEKDPRRLDERDGGGGLFYTRTIFRGLRKQTPFARRKLSPPHRTVVVDVTSSYDECARGNGGRLPSRIESVFIIIESEYGEIIISE